MPTLLRITLFGWLLRGYMYILDTYYVATGNQHLSKFLLPNLRPNYSTEHNCSEG